MRLRIERRGGLVGKTAVGECNVADLAPDQRKALDTLLAGAARRQASPGADRFRYKVILTDENGTRELEVPEDAMPDALASIPKIQL